MSIELKRLDSPLKCEVFGTCSIHDRPYQIIQISYLMFVELLMTWESLSPSESLLWRDFLNAFILQGFRRSHFHESAWSKDWRFGILASITYMGAGYHFVIMSLFRCFLSCILGVSWFSILSMVLIGHSLYLLDALQSLVLGFWIFRI